MKKIKLLSLFIFSLLLFVTCKKDTALEDYYYQEGNFSGSIYDALDSTGLYKYFIEGIDSAELTQKLKYTLMTVIAPTDKAFEEYLAKYGYGSISEIPKETLQDIIDQHIIEWPHAPKSLEEEPIYFKRKSNMALRQIVKTDIITNIEMVYAQEPKYLQFFYPQMLQYYSGSTNEYKLLTGAELSPETNFNIYNIPVTKILPYGNGWVYYVDKVIEPVENIDDWLLNSKYTTFTKLYNRFNYYILDDAIDKTVKVKRSNLNQYSRGQLIDVELCFETVGGSEGVTRTSLKAGSGFTVLVPNNDSLNQFINTYFKDYPEFINNMFVLNVNSIDSWHRNSIARSIISPYFFTRNLIFPNKFFDYQGVSGFDGTVFKLQSKDIINYSLCSNGFVYEIDKYIIPRSFKSILRPVFTSPDYKYFAAVVHYCNLLAFLNNSNENYTLMLPNDSVFIKNHIQLINADAALDYDAKYETNRYDIAFLNIDTVGGGSADKIEVGEVFDIVFSHLFSKKITPSAQTQYERNVIGYYVAIRNDSIWSGGNIENRWNTTGDTLPVIPKIQDEFLSPYIDNGSVYVVDDLIKAPEMTLATMINTNPAYSEFKTLCEDTKNEDDTPVLTKSSLSIKGNYPTVFIPTNDAVKAFKTAGLWPSNDEGRLNILKYFFIDLDVFTSLTINTTTETLSIDKTLSTTFEKVYRYMEVNGTPGNFQVKGENNTNYLNIIEGRESNVICFDGIIQQIDGVLY